MRTHGPKSKNKSRTCLASIEFVESFWLAAMPVLSIAPLERVV
jgi:hypothetical protein